MIISIVVIFVAHVLVPVLLIVGLWRGRFKSKIAWLAATLGYGSYILFMFLAGAGWGWVGYYLRVAVPLAFLCAAYVSFRRIFRTDAPWWRRPGSLGSWASLSVNVLLVILFAGSTVLIAPGFSYGNLRAAELSFPLRGAVWHVGHGGNNPSLNYHNVDRAQRFALDVDKLTPAGTRAWGIYPSEPDRYAAFGEEIYSPCAGEVIEVKDQLPDLRPPEADTENLAGNHVVLRCPAEDVDVILAHMREDSVAVRLDDTVEEGQPLGRVGNSGNTSEPHLHIHAVRTGSGSPLKGEGVPILFDGRFLVRNGLVF